MKSTLTSYLLIIFIFIPRLSWSQNDKGTVMLGGQIDLNSYSVTTPGIPDSYASEKTKSIGIAPSAGYFIFENFALGCEILYNGKRSTIPTGQKFSRTFSFEPFVRYYIGKGKIKPYLHAGTGPGWTKTRTTLKSGFPDQTQKSKLLIYEIRGGVEFLINKSVGFDFGFGYNSTTTYFKEPMVNGSFDEWEHVANGTTGSVAVIIHL
jgi:hypothetical protein